MSKMSINVKECQKMSKNVKERQKCQNIEIVKKIQKRQKIPKT